LTIRHEPFFIPWMAPSLNAWRGTNRYKQSSIAEDGHKAACVAKKLKVNGPCKIVFIPQHKRTSHFRDKVNYAPTIKAIEDGLVKRGVLLDDDHHHVIAHETRSAVKGKEVGMWVQIIEYHRDELEGVA
jgi:hypothetical protein